MNAELFKRAGEIVYWLQTEHLHCECWFTTNAEQTRFWSEGPEGKTVQVYCAANWGILHAVCKMETLAETMSMFRLHFPEDWT